MKILKKETLIALVVMLSLVVMAFLSVAPIEGADKDASNWMEALQDDRAINTLSIPGTHDSGATHSFADAAGKCQSLSVKEQLTLGVRFLDIRLKRNKTALDIVHSFVDQGASFDGLLADLACFLEENPSEFLFVSIKEDDSAVDPAASFAAMLEARLAEYSHLVAKDRTLPKTVGEARGKIYIISRYDGATLGVPAFHGWSDSTSFTLGSLYVQDSYRIDSVVEKQDDIELTLAISALYEHGLVLNFTSCYLTSGFPPSYAATPARTINPWLLELLPKISGSTGVMVCDFMTSELAELIIGRNFT